MDEAIEFIRTFIQKEYEFEVAALTERDESVYKQMWRDMLKFYAGGQVTYISRPKNPDENYFEKQSKFVDQMKPRDLYIVKQFKTEEHGDVYCCHVSSTESYSKGYFHRLFVGQTRAGLRIVATYGYDRFGKKWDFEGGWRMGRLGAPKDVRKLMPPENPEDRADYDAA